MKYLYLLVIALLVFTGCSRKMKPETIAAPPQYLEESIISQRSEAEVLKELNELHGLTASRYIIGPGDKFHIYVYDEAELDTREVIVKPDGAISMKLLGEIRVAGLSIPDASRTIEERLKEYVLYPKVSMVPYEMKSSRVLILGSVARPGSYLTENDMRVLDAISKAGGLATGVFQNNTIELADLERTYIVRGNDLLPIDFRALIREGDMMQNIPLMDGDYIYIPSAINREIYVLGEVNEPGHFAYKEDMTLLQIISYAQGFTTRAYRSRIFVIRGSLNHPRMFQINSWAALKAQEQDFRLKPNDVVYVPKTHIASWNDLLDKVMPSLQTIQGAWMVREIIRDE
ncbi:MAG: SLBB domain-containing protein [Candidatus Cloacimonetes bacterium]|nr:SLBB domain-containing protein [Candidatus Cloacimonadota bacterium]